MLKFPFNAFPYRYPYYRYYQYRDNSHSISNTPTEETEENMNSKNIPNNIQAKNRSFKLANSLPFSVNLDGFSDLEQPIIEVLGIKLYQDDLIILGLLFFLYKEEVKDESLFISLILLLLS